MTEITAPAALLDLDEEAMPGAAYVLYEAAHSEHAPGRAWFNGALAGTRDALLGMGLIAYEPNPHQPGKPYTVLTAAGWALAGTFSLSAHVAQGKALLARLAVEEDGEVLGALALQGKRLCDVLGRMGGRPREVADLSWFYAVGDMGAGERAAFGRKMGARLRVKAVADRDREAGVISDEQLDDWAADTFDKGRSNSVEALRPLTPGQRRAAYVEATTRLNVSPGYTLSSAVWQAARDVVEGRTPAGDMADRLMAHDPAGTKAAGHAARGGSWESFTRAAGA